MRLTRVACRDFMAFAEFDRDLTTGSSVVIVGKNGHGKSSVYDIVRYCAFGKGRFKAGQHGGTADQQIRHGADRLWTCIEFDTPDGQHVRIERSKAAGKAASIGLWVDGEDVVARDAEVARVSGRQHTNGETQALIDALIGMPYDMITAGPWMAQEQASAFMNADPRDRLGMFVKLFDAAWCGPLYDEAKKNRDRFESDRANAAARVAELVAETERQAEVVSARDALETQLNTLRDRDRLAGDQLVAVTARIAAASERARQWSSLEATERRLDQSIGDAQADVERRQGIIERARTLLAARWEEPPLPEQIDDSGIAALDAQLAVARAAQTRSATLHAQADAAKARLEELRGDRGLLATVPCGGEGEFASCQFLARVPAEAALAAMAEQVQAARNEASEQAIIGSEADDLAAAIDRLRTGARLYERASSDAALARQRHESATAAAERAIASEEATIAATRDRIAADRAERERVVAERSAIDRSDGAAAAAELSQIEGVRATIAARIAEVEPAFRRGEAAVAVIEKAAADLPGWRDKEAAAAADAETWSTLAKVFHPSGIPTLVVENGIGLIEERVNELLGSLPDDFHVQLRTQREKKTGGLSDVLDVVITTKGWETPYEFLSVGQRFRVDLALRLGISEVLSMRRGTRIETLWLDEPLADLDDEGRAAVADVLAELVATTEFGLVVVVSHHQDFNDRADTVVVIEQDDAGVSHDASWTPEPEEVLA